MREEELQLIDEASRAPCSMSSGHVPAGENFLQPAATRIGAPPRWKFGLVGKNYLPPGPTYTYRAQRGLQPSKANHTADA